MKIFMECAKCHKQWTLTVVGGLKNTICPHCKHDQMAKFDISSQTPEWFKSE